MVIIILGNSEHGAHAWKKTGLYLEIKLDFYLPSIYQMP